VPVDVWYIIPILAFTPSTSLAFLPDTPAGYGTYARTYEQFREAWFLMACRRDGEPKRHRHLAALQLLPFIRQDLFRMHAEIAKGSGQECPLYTAIFSSRTWRRRLLSAS
jgi:hypothetical protein